MKQTPRECVDKWTGTKLRVQSSEHGCILVKVDSLAVNPSGAYKKNPLTKPIISYPAQREILIALITKAGGEITI